MTLVWHPLRLSLLAIHTATHSWTPTPPPRTACRGKILDFLSAPIDPNTILDARAYRRLSNEYSRTEYTTIELSKLKISPGFPKVYYKKRTISYEYTGGHRLVLVWHRLRYRSMGVPWYRVRPLIRYTTAMILTAVTASPFQTYPSYRPAISFHVLVDSTICTSSVLHYPSPAKQWQRHWRCHPPPHPSFTYKPRHRAASPGRYRVTIVLR